LSSGGGKAPESGFRAAGEPPLGNGRPLAQQSVNQNR